MIEVIYQGHDGEETSGEIRLPKNVRQIGDATEDKRKIYVEDFVMSFVKQTVKERGLPRPGAAAVLSVPTSPVRKSRCSGWKPGRNKDIF